MRFPLLLALSLLFAAVPRSATAGVFMGAAQELVDPAKGEKPTLVLSFDEKLRSASLKISTQEGWSKSWSIGSVSPGQDLRYSWDPPKQGEVMYDVAVTMVHSDGREDVLEDLFFISSASPISASIDPSSVDLDARTFQLKTNHKPSMVEMTVLSDTMQELGKATVDTADAKDGQPVTLTWPQDAEGNVLRVSVRAHDPFGYYADVDIIPWSLTIPHDDVIFPTASHEILPEEAPKADAAWTRIAQAIKKYGEIVQVTLYVGGYTDTVGDAGSNQGLSERRAKALADYFRSKGANVPVYYQGFGESVLAKPTGDGVDEAANRRAVYILTAGPAPRSKETPRAAWKKL